MQILQRTKDEADGTEFDKEAPHDSCGNVWSESFLLFLKQLNLISDLYLIFFVMTDFNRFLIENGDNKYIFVFERVLAILSTVWELCEKINACVNLQVV